MTSVHFDDIQTAAAGPVDDILAAALGSARAARWRQPREGYRPETAVVRSEGALVAALLTSARPTTAATKIVDLWWKDGADASAAALLDDAIDRARARGDVAVKWEVPAGAELPRFAVERGFVEMRRPWAAVGTEDVRGYVAWLTDASHDEVGYYAQTTLFTCGAVAALIAADAQGRPGLTGGPDDRDLEIAFWRGASNYPACEPVGLAVALGELIETTGVEVALDLEGPALLESYSDFDRDFRAELQDESRRKAAARGIPVRDDRVEIDEIARRVSSGEQALLLIDEAPMHGEVGPHWILAHARVGGTVLVQDPWINVEAGETWVDTHDLPVPFDALDQLVRWSETGYRGVIFTGRAG